MDVRIYLLVRPANDSSPTITYQLIYGLNDHSLGNDPGTTMARFQFACCNTTYSSMVDVAKQVKAAFQDFSGVMSGTGGMDVQSVLQVDAGGRLPFRRCKTV